MFKIYIGRIFFLILFMSMALFSGFCSAAMSVSELTTAVNNLPESTEAERLKKAMLLWGLEDALDAQAAGQTQVVNDTYADIEEMLDQNIGQSAPALPNYFPAIPDFANNFLAQQAVSDVLNLRGSELTYPRGEELVSTYERTLTNEGLELTTGLCHPQSPYSGDPTIVRNMMRRFQRYFDLTGEKTVDFFSVGPGVKMYLLFTSRYPDLLLPSRKLAWENAIKANILENSDLDYTFAPGEVGVSWLNGDCAKMMAFLYAYYVFDDQAYLDKAEVVLEMLEASLFPDGAFPYIASMNESYSYHEVAIVDMFLYWQITGDSRARDIIEKSFWYYPLNAEPSVTAEYGSAPCWKQTWNMVQGAYGAYIVASLTGSGENYRVFEWGGGLDADFFIAAIYRDDLNAAAMPDNYITYDRNILGPRARFGNFSYFGTCNRFTADAPFEFEDKRSKITHVGCMVLDAGAGWNLNAGVCAAASRVRAKMGIQYDETSYTGRYQPHHYVLSRDDRNSSIVCKRFASLTTKYQLCRFNNETYPWIGKQQWVFTPKSMIGLLSIESTAADQQYGVSGMLKLVSGRAYWGTKKYFVNLGGGVYSYGKLRVKIHEHDYYDISTEYAYTTSWDGTEDQLKCGRLIARDEPESINDELWKTWVANGSVGDEPNPAKTNYPAGTKHYFIAEIYPEDSSPSDSITYIPDDGSGLVGYEVERADIHSKLRILHNPTDSTIPYQATLSWGAVILHQSGEQYRPDWMNVYNTDNAPDFRERQRGHINAVNLRNGVVNVMVPPYEHVVIEKNSVCLGNGNRADINGDCYIDINDFSILAGAWLNCTNPTDIDCVDLMAN